MSRTTWKRAKQVFHEALEKSGPDRSGFVASACGEDQELRAQVREGRAVLLVSTDLDEVLELGQRIAVLFRGRLLPVPEGAGRDEIGARMLGQA